MFEAPEIDLQTTDGEIAVINLESARRRLWTRFSADPPREGNAEALVENERLTAQFVGDATALDFLRHWRSNLSALTQRQPARP